MVTKGFLLDKAKNKLGIDNVEFKELHNNVIQIIIKSKFISFDKLSFFINKETGEIKNECDLIALRDFLNDVLQNGA